MKRSWKRLCFSLRWATSERMADDEDGSETSPNGNDWEVVSLTASVYAAAPGPKLPPDEKNETGYVATKYESSSDAMFMSRHFQSPADTHENLVKQFDRKGVQNEFCDEDFSHEESCKSELNDDMSSIHFLGKEKNLSYGDFVGEDPSMFHHRSDPADISCPNVDAPMDPMVVSAVSGNNGNEGSDHPCEVWWKRKVSFVYGNAKEATTFWSIFVAATIVGLAIVGHHWQREKLQYQQVRLQFNVNSERISCTMEPHSWFKSALFGGNQQNPLVRGCGRVEI